MNTEKRIWFLFVLCLFSFKAPDPPSILQKIKAGFDYFHNHYPQQKVYLHLDKTTYYADENIWFKAYLVDAATLLPDTLSQQLYVEIVNDHNQLRYFCRLKPENGCAHGNFFLKDTIKQGNYMIKAYTPYMQNFDEQYFFTQKIKILNPKYGQLITKQTEKDLARTKKEKRKNTAKTILNFHPEGGIFLSGQPNTLQISSVNANGTAISASGAIYENKEQIFRFTTDSNGLAIIELTAKPEKKYYALLDQNKKHFPLPEPTNAASLLKFIRHDKDSIYLQVISNKPIDVHSNKYVLAGYHFCNMFFLETVELKNNQQNILIAKSSLPSGTLNFTLFNINRKVESNNMLFFGPHEEFIITVTPKNNIHNQSDSTGFEISVVPSSSVINNSTSMNLSVSVCSYESNRYPKHININEYFSFFSDVKTNTYVDLENPLYTRQVLLAEQQKFLSWNDILQEKYPEIIYPPGKKISIEGKTTRMFFGIPYEGASVELFIKDQYNDIFSTYSDNSGKFKFENLDYYDTIHAKISARKTYGSKNILIHLSDFQPPIKHLQFDYDETLLSINRTGNVHYTYTATPPVDSNQHQMEGLYGRPDYVIYMNQIPPGQSNLYQVIQGRVPGVNVSGNNVVIRGPGSLKSNEPLVLVDNVPSDITALDHLNPNDVERIEFVKGTGTAIYGSRGAAGIISIYTKRGTFMKKGEIDFEIPGYHVPIPFTTSESTNYKPFTLYWNPEIIVKENEKFEVTYLNPENSTTVLIIIEGLSDNGTTGSKIYTYKTN